MTAPADPPKEVFVLLTRSGVPVEVAGGAGNTRKALKIANSEWSEFAPYRVFRYVLAEEVKP